MNQKQIFNSIFSITIFLNIFLIQLINTQVLYDDHVSNLDQQNQNPSDLNKEFWETLYQNSMLNTRTKYNALNDERVCFTCPIDRTIFTNLYHEALETMTNNPQQQSPPRVTITWSAQLNENRVIFFCSNNTRKAPNPLYLSGNINDNSNENSGASSTTQLEYSCENNRLCLNNIKNGYPKNYQCLVKSYVLNVKLDVIVQLTHVLLYFSGDSVKFDYQKEVQVHENQIFTVKCEVPESNPVSTVKAYIDNRELKLTGLEKKTLENRMTINTYSYEVNATRSMNGKRVKCDAQMNDIPPDLANSIDLRSHLFKDYTISVYYLPTCVYKERIYRTGINRSITIECPINGSNPDVTYYKMIPPSTRTKFELIDNNLETLRKVGRYRINPISQADFGLYECIPRSLAGTAKCDIIVELGATPNPPDQCNVQFAKVNNKTFAQFSCKPGHNQGGTTSFLSIYEIVDKQLKLSGRVNIDESKVDKEVPYITPADEDKYYEFLIMQENNYGNSTSIVLTLGVPQNAKPITVFDFKNLYMVAGAVAALMLVVCVCSCCCCSDVCASSKSDNALCKCCCPSSDHGPDDGLTYKKAPIDADALGPTNSRVYQSYSPETNNMKFGYNPNSNYDYYDNTSTGLLADGQSYNEPYTQTIKSRKQLQQHRSNQRPYDNNQDDSYDNNYEDDDHYMNDNDAALNNKEHDNFSLNENPDDSLSSSPKSDEDQNGLNSATTPINTKNTSALFTNNVSGHIGSGVESIKKHTYNLNTDVYTRKQQVKFSNNGTYSTVDRKNLKLIKTDNGLVYTPKSNPSGLATEENDHELENGYDYDNCDEQSKKLLNTNYSSLKKINHHPSFQAELSQKLKSINKPDHELYSKNLKLQTTNTTTKQGLLPSASYTQSEQLSNSTATTSVSSASSCASNSDLIIKKESIYATSKRPLLQTQLESNSNLNLNQNASSSSNNNKNYSLLKTTINVGNNMNNSELNNTNDTLSRNGTLNKTNKPPILKPKPRNNNYQSVQIKNHLNNSESLHNQSVEPLINQTSPTTSVTDLSSTNCTPQHYLMEEIGQVNSILNKQSLTRSRSNSLNKTTQQVTTSTVKNGVTTTFGAKTTTVNQNQIYSTIKLNCDYVPVNSTMKTFSPNSKYDSSTINRKLNNINNSKNLKSIDDEINSLNSNNSNTRTIERRHVKNSEC